MVWQFYRPTWKCYGYTNRFFSPKTWSEAREFCRQFTGGDLAAVTNPGVAYTIATTWGWASRSWIGGYQKPDGTWHWSDGSPFNTNFANFGWHGGQPDNAGGNQGYITTYGGYWDDMNGDWKGSLICQKKM